MTKTRIVDLHKEANLEMLDTRLKKLRKRYIEKALTNKNPVFNELVIEYLNFKGGEKTNSML